MLDELLDQITDAIEEEEGSDTQQDKLVNIIVGNNNTVVIGDQAQVNQPNGPSRSTDCAAASQCDSSGCHALRALQRRVSHLESLAQRPCKRAASPCVVSHTQRRNHAHSRCADARVANPLTPCRPPGDAPQPAARRAPLPLNPVQSHLIPGLKPSDPPQAC